MEVPVVYTVNGKDYKTTVKVPVTVVEGKEQLVPKGDKPDPKDNITPGNYPDGATFEYDTPVDTSKPGKKEAVVIVKDKDGKEIVRVPVVVNVVEPKVTPIIVPERTKLTKEDVEKHIEIPGVTGWEIVGEPELPETFPAGVRPSATVTVKLPNGKTIKVQVPVIATPTTTPIEVPQGTTITPDDVKKHVNIPKESGWEIIEVGEIPTTIPAGVKPSVKVKIKVPTGEIIEVEVPIIVTPTVTPIVVEVGTPITKEDVIKKVGLPEGWEIVEVGEIPTTETPGDKPSVTVEIELPDGRKVTVEVPVKVTPKSNHGNSQGNNGSSTIHIVTRYQDGDGKEISPEENGSHGPKTLEGYEYIGTKTDKNGNVIHTYKKVATPTRSEQPVSPVRPTDPEKPVATPVQTSSTDSKPVAVETAVANDKKELPNTGTEDKSNLASLGLLGMLGAFGLVARKKKED